jgi:heat shock protein HslJ
VAARDAPEGLLGQIGGAEWRAVRLVVGGASVGLAAESVPTLALGMDGSVNGLATVNRYFGKLKVGEDGAVRWDGPLGSTRMAGPENLMDQEVRFLQALQGARRASLRDGTLVLEDEGGQNLIEFRR